MRFQLREAANQVVWAKMLKKSQSYSKKFSQNASKIP